MFPDQELQEGDMEQLVQLREINELIENWYEDESKKVITQARIFDVQLSEKTRIYHHEQHLKHIKKSAILKLETENGVIEGHEACAEFLTNQVAELLLNPTLLDVDAQNALLTNVDKVFTDTDNDKLKQLPSKEDEKKVLCDSNLKAVPGNDGITSFLLGYSW